MSSILKDVKKHLGIEEDYTHFDTDIIDHINSVFNILYQLGGKDFSIEDNTESWDCYEPDLNKIKMIKSYFYTKVRLLFDPPLNGTLIQLLQEQCKEFECRFSYQVDPGEEENSK